jgi:hypothetical protein
MCKPKEGDEHPKRGQKQVKIVGDLEPRSYSGAIGDATRELKPHLQVTIVESNELAPEVERLAPELVLCSQHKPDREGGPVWIGYRPYTESKATIWGRSQSWKLAVVELADLPSVVDPAEDLVCANLSPKAAVEPDWA